MKNRVSPANGSWRQSELLYLKWVLLQLCGPWVTSRMVNSPVGELIEVFYEKPFHQFGIANHKRWRIEYLYSNEWTVFRLGMKVKAAQELCGTLLVQEYVLGVSEKRLGWNVRKSLALPITVHVQRRVINQNRHPNHWESQRVEQIHYYCHHSDISQWEYLTKQPRLSQSQALNSISSKKNRFHFCVWPKVELHQDWTFPQQLWCFNSDMRECNMHCDSAILIALFVVKYTKMKSCSYLFSGSVRFEQFRDRLIPFAGCVIQTGLCFVLSPIWMIFEVRQNRSPHPTDGHSVINIVETWKVTNDLRQRPRKAEKIKIRFEWND